MTPDDQAADQASAVFAGAMEAIDGLQTLVAIWTGTKAGFVAQGWAPEAAEQITVELARMAACSTMQETFHLLHRITQPADQQDTP